MYNWQGKKLLVFGATKLLCQVVDEAHKYGAKVVAIDYFENSPAKKIADESYLVSTVDVDAVVSLIKEKKIDGIVTGFMDSMLPFYKKICEKTNLPCYITSDEQINFTTDKKLFKQYLQKYDIPYVPEYKSGDNIEFPVIVKPVDNSGARGISVCRNAEELEKGIALALDNSKSKKYLIEKYLDYKEATIFYLFIDGKAYFTLMGNRYMRSVKDGFIKLPTGYSFPSEYSEIFVKELDDKFQKIFQDLSIQNGMMFLQCFVDNNGKIIPYEPGFRLTGSLEYILLDAVCGYNPLAMMINFALTGKMAESDEISKINPIDIKKCYNISCLIKPGKIQKIAGVEKLKNIDGIVDVVPAYDAGNVLDENAWGKLSQIGVRLFVAPKDDAHYAKIEQEIKENLEVIDENGQSMIINHLIKE